MQTPKPKTAELEEALVQLLERDIVHIGAVR
jgi:hypothetical protein